MQPAQSYSYRVDPCSPLSCDYTALIAEIENISTNVCKPIMCPHTAKYEAIDTRKKVLEKNNVLVFMLDNEQIEVAELLISEKKLIILLTYSLPVSLLFDGKGDSRHRRACLSAAALL
jgi:hypothetical protein